MSTTKVSAAMQDAGAIVQVVNTQTGAVATGTTVIPQDDTIPQNTEGDEYMTLAVTPTNANNILEINIEAYMSPSTPGWMIMALFQDSTAGALAVGGGYMGTGTEAVHRTFTYRMVAGTVSATTFKFRAGLDLAGTTSFNGKSTARHFGGVLTSSINVKEIAV